MTLRNVLIVYRKELLDMMRDRRTLFATLVFPLVLFPLLSTGFAKLSEMSLEKTRREAQRIMLLGEEHAPELAARIRADEQFDVVAPEANFREQINEKKLRAAVEFPPGFQASLEQGAPAPEIRIYLYQTELRSEAAAERLEAIAREYREQVVGRRLASRGFSAALLKPVETRREDVARAEQVAGMRLGRLLPYFIILLCASGALHPAIDLTAGEKERGTLETLLASAARRIELVAGKFLVVLTLSLVTTLLALGSFAYSVLYLQRGGSGASETFTVSAGSAVLVFALVLPVAVLLSGVLLALAVFAKSYKEAQSYTGYVMLGVLLPAIGSVLPGVEINPVTAWVPILNVSLVAQEIFTGSFPWLSIALVLISSCVYAALGLGLAAWQFNREEVLFRA
ncbi:MAG: ABC transporter permease subunit [Acidobacteriia bacterium]|nr:ABC transporter permease subunit [Terriglobia bacterium]